MNLENMAIMDKPAYTALHSFLTIHSQAQYSTREQIEVLLMFAEKLKLNEAADYLKKCLDVSEFSP